jgi:hypothetical protein
MMGQSFLVLELAAPESAKSQSRCLLMLMNLLAVEREREQVPHRRP